MTLLILHVNEKYFDQIKSGEKTEEYRLVKRYWISRFHDKKFDGIVIMKGYPKFSEMCSDNRIDFPFKGIVYKTIIHEKFGKHPVYVFAIKLEK